MNIFELTLIVLNAIIIGGILYLIARPQNPNIILLDDGSNIVTDNTAGIHKDMACNLIKNYRVNQYTHIVGTTGCDARSAWFSLDAIKKFVLEIESKSLTNLRYDHATLGIRFYYGAYPSDPKDSAWDLIVTTPLPGGYTDADKYKKDYAGKHTLLLVPTYKTTVDGASVNMDFDPDQVTTDIAGVTTPTAMDVIFRTSPGSVMMLNHSSLAPPPDDIMLKNSADKCGTAVMDCADS